jgi:hypothetical protein
MANGTAMPKAQGQDITITVREKCNSFLDVPRFEKPKQENQNRQGYNKLHKVVGYSVCKALNLWLFNNGGFH